MDTSEEIIQLERQALERWAQGDPDGFLEITAPDVVYFDPFLKQALFGIEALRRHYDSLRGKVSLSRFELLDPHVQVVGDAAVLTFRFASWGGGGAASLWNTTEVYRRDAAGWRIVHTHWAFGCRG